MVLFTYILFAASSNANICDNIAMITLIIGLCIENIPEELHLIQR